MPTDYRSMYEKDFLGAWDFTDGDKTFTMKKAQRGELTGSGGRKSKKPVVYFQETDKGLALNATNGKTIAAMYGVMVEDWQGKKITLYKSRTTMGSEEVDCVRVRPQKPKGAASTFNEAEADADALVIEEQAAELRMLCTTGGRDLSNEFKAAAKVDDFSDVLAVDYAGGKKWISKQRGIEFRGGADKPADPTPSADAQDEQ